MKHCKIEIEQPERWVDEDRATLVFLAAIEGEIPATTEVKPAEVLPSARAFRAVCDAGASADEAARMSQQQRVIAPLLMVLALGLLFAAAGGS